MNIEKLSQIKQIRTGRVNVLYWDHGTLHLGCLCTMIHLLQMAEQARTGLCATVPWHMGPYWGIKWALDNCCLISVFVNIQRYLKQTIRQYETKIKGTGWE